MCIFPQKILRKISALLTGLILLVAIFIFLCPMVGNTAGASFTDLPSISALCTGHAVGAALPGGMNASGCLGLHFSILEQFTEALFEKASVLFVVLLTAFSIFVRGAPPIELFSWLVRLRQRFYLYFKIRYQFQKNFLAWLLFARSFSIAPVA